MTMAYVPAHMWRAEDRLRELFAQHDALADQIAEAFGDQESWDAATVEEKTRRVAEAKRLRVDYQDVETSIVVFARRLLD